MKYADNLNFFMHIWSDYGDEIVVDKGQKLTKWCPAGKVSQRLSMKERGAKVLKQKKKSKKKSVKDGKGDKKPTKGLYTRESEAQLMLQAMAFNEKVSTVYMYACISIPGIFFIRQLYFFQMDLSWFQTHISIH